MYRCIIFQTKEFADDRKIILPIDLPIDPYQNQSIVILNQTFESKTFFIGFSDPPKERLYNDLIFRLIYLENNEEPWSLQFEYEMSDMKESIKKTLD